MSNRHLKSLKLNSVIIGEYLGSDDQDEDIEAARDMLRAKSPTPSPRLNLTAPAPIHGRPHYAKHSFFASGSQEEIALGRRPDDHPWIERLRFMNSGGALADVGILEVIRQPLVSAELSGALARCLSVPDFASHHLRSATADSDVASS